MLNCKFCNNEFKTISSLNSHQKKARYCLALHQEKPPSSKIFECIACNKTLSSKQMLTLHILSCTEYKLYQVKNKYKNKIKFLKLQIDELKLENKELRLRPTTINNNYNIKTYIQQHFMPITPDSLSKHAATLTKDHLYDGGAGIALHAVEFPIADTGIVCTDGSRKNFKWLNAMGDVKDDPKLVTFAPMYYSSIREKAETYTDECLAGCGVINNKILDTIQKIKMGAKGDITENFHKEFTHIVSCFTRKSNIIK